MQTFENKILCGDCIDILSEVKTPFRGPDLRRSAL